MATPYPLDDAKAAARGAGDALPPGAIERHAAVDRAFHWITAATMFVLLGTSLLPVVGIHFAWVEIHWIAGIVLTAAVLFHIIRATFWQKLRCMWIRARDFKELRGAPSTKYTLAQKSMHLAFSLALLTAIVTGVLMLAKVQTPFLERDPYLFTESAWGVIHVLHDLSAFLSVTLVIIHVYFSLLPEKRVYLRSMVKGWVTREELREQNHDVDRMGLK
jgi:formate dehydrogenase subunit gamma